MSAVALRVAARASLLALAAAVLGGCLGYDEQEIRFRVDPQKDRLDVLLVYRGLFNDSLVPPSAESQLDSIQRGERVFSALDPALLFNLDATPALKEARWTPTTSIKVEHGRVFRAKDGRLCAWQLVRVPSLSALLGAANDAYREWLATPEGARQFLGSVSSSDAASAELLKRSVADKHAFFALRGNAISFRIPVSSEGQRAIFTRVTDALTKSASDPSARKRLDRDLALYASAELSWIRSGDVSECVIGNPERAEQRIVVPRRRDEIPDNLGDLLASKKVRVHDDVTEASITKEFEAFCAR